MKCLHAFDIWKKIHWLLAASVSLPFIFLSLHLFTPGNENWQEIKNYLLTDYIINTVSLTMLSAFFATAFGLFSAWLVSMYAFPGRRLFQTLLVLPLAIPPYIAAYTYDSLFSYTGHAHILLRYLGINWFAHNIAIPTIAFGVCIFSLTLYPYVYLLARAFLYRQSAAMLESARLLSHSERDVFLRVFLPLLRPSLFAGGTLVALEVLNDFGVASHLGIHTFSTGIFTIWFGMADVDTAVKLSFSLLGILFAIIFLNREIQKRRPYKQASSKERPLSPQPLTGKNGFFAAAFCLLLLFAACILPLGQMLYWAGLTYKNSLNSQFAVCIFNTLKISIAACFLIMLPSALLANASRLFPGHKTALLTQIATSGYATPSAVLSMGIISLFSALDSAAKSFFAGAAPTLGLSISMLIFAYAVRFFTVGYQAVENQFTRLGNIYTEAARTLGCNITQSFWRVDLPLLKNSLLAGAALVFIDVVKELPLALTLRPFNFETLGTKVYMYAGNEAIEEAACASLAIIGASSLFIMLLERKGGK